MNKEIAQVLRAAKERLWDGVQQPRDATEYICTAIRRIEHPAKRDAVRFFERRLVDCGDLDWLKMTGNAYFDLGARERQQARHQWLDELIQELEA